MDNPFNSGLDTSGIVSGQRARDVAGEAYFQGRAEHVGGSTGAWILLKIVKVEQEARMKPYSRTGLEAILVEVDRGEIEEDLVINEYMGAPVGAERTVQQQAIAITGGAPWIADEFFEPISVS
jgi:diphthamide synthase (EF-2-diphthine--ammonia ligase)